MASDSGVPESEANGFRFQRYDSLQLESALDRACRTYRDQPDTWRRLAENGMRQDWSWKKSATEYQSLYARIQEARSDVESLGSQA